MKTHHYPNPYKFNLRSRLSTTWMSKQDSISITPFEPSEDDIRDELRLLGTYLEPNNEEVRENWKEF